MNLRPPGYEPDELPDCSTPRRVVSDDKMNCTIVSRKCQGFWAKEFTILRVRPGGRPDRADSARKGACRRPERPGPAGRYRRKSTWPGRRCGGLLPGFGPAGRSWLRRRIPLRNPRRRFPPDPRSAARSRGLFQYMPAVRWRSRKNSGKVRAVTGSTFSAGRGAKPPARERTHTRHSSASVQPAFSSTERGPAFSPCRPKSTCRAG